MDMTKSIKMIAQKCYPKAIQVTEFQDAVIIENERIKQQNQIRREFVPQECEKDILKKLLLGKNGSRKKLGRELRRKTFLVQTKRFSTQLIRQKPQLSLRLSSMIPLG